MAALAPSNWKQVRFPAYLVVLFIDLYRLVCANRKDRALICEALGAGIFLVALLLYGVFRVPDWFVAVCGLIAVAFAILACYFTLVNWAERGVKEAQAK